MCTKAVLSMLTVCDHTYTLACNVAFNVDNESTGRAVSAVAVTVIDKPSAAGQCCEIFTRNADLRRRVAVSV